MINFITDLLIMSTVMSLIIILITVFKKPMKKLSPCGRYIIWSLVIIRLCIPFGVSFLPDLISIPLQTAQEVVFEEKAESVISVPDPLYSGDETVTSVYTDNGTSSNETKEKIKEKAAVSSVKTENKEFELEKEYIPYAFVIVWGVGAITFVICNMNKYLKNTKILNATLKESDKDQKEIYFKVCKEYNVINIPPLYVSRVSKTPMVYGFIKPKIILPDIEIRKEDIYGVLSHEIIHFKRRDLFIKFMAMLANAIHWFNPFVYLACRKLFSEMELSCDERVLKKASKEQRISYGVAMLEIVKKCKRSAPSLTTGFNPKSKAVKERFENILDTAVKKKGMPLIILVICVSVISTSIIGCGSKTENTYNKNVENESLTKTDTPNNYKVLLNYQGEIENIQPYYDIMDNSMEALGISKLTNSKGEFLIDYKGEIRAELPKSEVGYKYCSVCNKITDHINSVDPFTLECSEQNSGHGGGNGYYIYDKETNMILKTEIGIYTQCNDVDFAIVSEAAAATEGVEAVEVKEEGYSGHFEYVDGERVFVKEYFYRPSGYYTQTGKFAITVGGKLATDFEYDGYLDFDVYGICALKKDGKWGYYNHKGEMLYDHLYEESDIWVIGDHAQKVPYSSSCGLIALKKDGKWGYGDTEGNIIVDFIFEQARPVSCGKAWVKDEEGWKIIEFTNIEMKISSAEAAVLANDYLDNFYYSEPKPTWKFVSNSEKEYYSTPCYSFNAYVYGGEYDIYFTHEMIVTKDKIVYQTSINGDYPIYSEREQ